MESPTGGGDSSKINKNPPKTPLIFFTTFVNQHKVKILIDTGANSTFINEKVLQHMIHLRYIHRKSYSFTLADGIAPFHALGLVELSVHFANSITKIQAHIARQLCADMIIGMDYINVYNLNINVRHQTISIENNNRLFTMNMDREYELRRIPVILSKSTFVPPRSKSITQVSNPISSIYSTFVPTSDFLEQNYLLTHYTYLKFQNYLSNMVFFNKSSYPRFLSKGSCVGFLFCCSSDRSSSAVSRIQRIPLDVTGSSGMTSVSGSLSVKQSTDGKSFGVTEIAGVTPASNDLFTERMIKDRFSSSDSIMSQGFKEVNGGSNRSFCNIMQTRESIVEEHIHALSSRITDKKKQKEVHSLLMRFPQTFDITKHNIAHTPINHVINTIPHSPPACRAYPQSDKEESMYKLIQEFLQASTFIPQISKLQDTQDNNWDEYLQAVTFAYNTGIHKTTQYSPFELLFGRYPRLPINTPPTHFVFTKPNDYFEQLKKTLRIYHQSARYNMIQQQQINKIYYDRNRLDPHYEIGNKVLTRIYGIRGKLDPKFAVTPKVIVHTQHPIYIVEDEVTHNQSRIHVSDLRPIFFN